MKREKRGVSIHIIIVMLVITVMSSNAHAASEESSWLDKVKKVIEISYNQYFDPVPKCSDEAVLSLLPELYGSMRQSSIESAGWNDILLASVGLPQSIERIELARSTGYKRSIKLRSCSANAIFAVNNQKEITINISYSVQLNEQNSEEFFVILEPDFISTLNKRVLGITGLAPMK